MRVFAGAAVTGAVLMLSAGGARAQEKPAAPGNFAIADGERVVFYGDSITEQRQYTSDIENYILTRFPAYHVEFVQSGVGGDRTRGGARGPIDLRLHRDIFEHNPTVVTVMLGMNDGEYRQYDENIFTTYSNGYRYIVDEIQKAFPKAKVTLVKPSAYDDVTREPLTPGGYNATLVKYGAFVGDLATEKNTGVADMNAPVVDALTKARAENPALSTLLINDRVHPGPAIHWVMAEAVLKSWNAPATVTAVNLSVEHESVVVSDNTDTTDLAILPTGLTWTQQDRALPLPIGPVDAD